MIRLSKNAMQRLGAVMAALLLVQNIHPVTVSAALVQQKVVDSEVQPSEYEEADESHHNIEKRSVVKAGLKFVLDNFWDDLLCLGVQLATMANCNSLSLQACERVRAINAKRTTVAMLVNETRETQVEWATLNSTNEKAIINLQLIEKDLELLTASNLRLMGILKAISAVVERENLYDSATDKIAEIRIRFQIDMETYLNGIQEKLAAAGSQIDSSEQGDHLMFAIMTAIPLVALHTRHIVTSARQADLARSQSYQVVDIDSDQGRLTLAFNRQGGLYIVQESLELGTMKVLHLVSGRASVGRLWKYLTTPGQAALAAEFQNSADFERGKRIAWLQQNDPLYLRTLEQMGYVPAFLSRSEGLSPGDVADFVRKIKRLNQDNYFKFDTDTPQGDLPRQLRPSVDVLNRNDLAAVNAYDRLKTTNHDLLDKLNKAGSTGKFIENAKTLTDAEFDDYVAKVKAAAPELPDGNLKRFEWDVPAKKVTFTQGVKNGWSSFRNFDLLNWRGRQLKITDVLTLGAIFSTMNAALCLYVIGSSSESVEENLVELETNLNEAQINIVEKKGELDSLLIDEKDLFVKIKRNTVSLYNLLGTDDNTIADDPSCQDTLCTFLRDAAQIQVISDFLATWNNDTVTSSTILASQLDFIAILKDSKTEMSDLYYSIAILTKVMNWVTDGLTLDRMLENAVSLNLNALLPDHFSILKIIKAAFPLRSAYDGIPLSCIGTSITTQEQLEAFLVIAAPITGPVIGVIKAGAHIGASVDTIVVVIENKVNSGELPANPCNGHACTRDDVLKVIATEYSNQIAYDGEVLAAYRNTATC